MCFNQQTSRIIMAFPAHQAPMCSRFGCPFRVLGSRRRPPLLQSLGAIPSPQLGHRRQQVMPLAPAVHSWRLYNDIGENIYIYIYICVVYMYIYIYIYMVYGIIWYMCLVIHYVYMLYNCILYMCSIIEHVYIIMLLYIYTYIYMHR